MKIDAVIKLSAVIWFLMYSCMLYGQEMKDDFLFGKWYLHDIQKTKYTDTVRLYKVFPCKVSCEYAEWEFFPSHVFQLTRYKFSSATHDSYIAITENKKDPDTWYIDEKHGLLIIKQGDLRRMYSFFTVSRNLIVLIRTEQIDSYNIRLHNKQICPFGLVL